MCSSDLMALYRQARLDQHVRSNAVGVASCQVQTQQVAVVIGFGAAARDVSLALVAVQAIGQAGVDKVVVLGEAAVQG